jgi:uncharacterized phiE125 gp8 family phage protein
VLTIEPLAVPPAAVGEAKTYLRIMGADEDALVARLVRIAAELCEQFTGQLLLVREVVERANGRGSGWRRLGRAPVRSITGVEAIGQDGEPATLAADAYAIDIDGNGDGWVRADGGGVLRVQYQAGLAADWDSVPEPLRHGAIRMAAHLYAHRDAARAEGPPAAVTALWRPWRRLRIGGTCSKG